MKAIILEKAGGLDQLQLKELEQPALGENEVLVAVKAISVNPVDFKVRAKEELLDAIYGKERPAILGWDIAGTITSVGSAVTQFNVGDHVFGMVNFPGAGKAYAEFVAVPENQLANKPTHISFVEAAATTLAALTALQGLQDRVKQGDRVLIHAGSGGVGHFAIQIAKHLGAYVVTTGSAKNKDFVLSLGADEHIDYREHPFEEVATNIDLVLDGIGGEVVAKSLKVMNHGGTIISLPTNQFADEVLSEAGNRDIEISWMLVQSNGEDMNILKGMLEDGILKPHVSKIFNFTNMAQAHKALETGRTVGKVAVTL